MREYTIKHAIGYGSYDFSYTTGSGTSWCLLLVIIDATETNFYYLSMQCIKVQTKWWTDEISRQGSKINL